MGLLDRASDFRKAPRNRETHFRICPCDSDFGDHRDILTSF